MAAQVNRQFVDTFCEDFGNAKLFNTALLDNIQLGVSFSNMIDDNEDYTTNHQQLMNMVLTNNMEPNDEFTAGELLEISTILNNVENNDMSDNEDDENNECCFNEFDKNDFAKVLLTLKNQPTNTWFDTLCNEYGPKFAECFMNTDFEYGDDYMWFDEFCEEIRIEHACRILVEFKKD
jgi:hypothetical protein